MNQYVTDIELNCQETQSYLTSTNTHSLRMSLSLDRAISHPLTECPGPSHKATNLTTLTGNKYQNIETKVSNITT